MSFEGAVEGWGWAIDEVGAKKGFTGLEEAPAEEEGRLPLAVLRIVRGMRGGSMVVVVLGNSQ